MTESGIQSTVAGYRNDAAPLGAYAGLMAAFATVSTGVGVLALSRGRANRPLPWSDLALVAVGVHRLSRLISKDRVTSALRAPFVEYEGPGLPSELEEKPRGGGARLAVGQLLNCPYCLGEWLALAGVAGLIFAPRPTRLAATVLSVATVADVLQELYVQLSPAEQ
ncbi:MAG TPA: DUF1360 domain-containing protein [Gaiellales bacterium]|nr:DUF1360 domain-containing protein [Gaiellales bacterium]